MAERTWYRHFRIHRLDPETGGMVRWHAGGVTVCAIEERPAENEPGHILLGMAVCSTHDGYNKGLGRKIAHGRARAQKRELCLATTVGVVDGKDAPGRDEIVGSLEGWALHEFKKHNGNMQYGYILG